MDYTVIIPAFNEEDFLPATLHALELAMQDTDHRGTVIVVDNNSTDATAEVARSLGAQVVFEPVNQISRARNAGAAAAETPALIFLDADTQPSASLLRKSLDRLESGAVCGGGAELTFDEAPANTEFMTHSWNWLSSRMKLAAGSYIYCLRQGFEDIGGFSLSVYAGEEVFFSHRLKRWGRARGLQFEIITGVPVITSARKLDWFSPPRMIAHTLLLALLPFLARFRAFCGPWYRRPKGSKRR